jgi:hypothetical protein
MKTARYTAIISHGEKILFIRNNSFLEDLQASLITIMQDKFSYAYGRIIDNFTGDTVQTFRQQTSLE